MNDLEKPRPNTSKYEIIAAVVLAILAVGSFAVQAYLMDSTTTQRETVLFNTLQFLLTVGFTWFSTRAVSRAEFERSLKQFAIGAYRRITDIEAMIERLRGQLQNMRAGPTGPNAETNLAVVSAVLEDTVQVVRSSTADWADVIGQELLAMDAIRNLRQQKTELATAPENADPSQTMIKRLREIDASIAALTSKLPANLQFETKKTEQDEVDRFHRARWLRERHEKEGGTALEVVAGAEYRCDGDIGTLAPETKLFALLDQEIGIAIEDASGQQWGRLLNDSPLDYDLFRKALRDCYDTKRIDVQYVGNVRRKTIKGEAYCWYTIKVLAPPKSRIRKTA